MHYLYYIIGKSATGKDSLFRALLDTLPLRAVIPSTTRPRRANEIDGQEYFFIGQDELGTLRAQGHILEERTYQTVHGPWTYCTTDRGADLSAGSMLGLGTLDSYNQLRAHFGEQAVVPIYVQVDDYTRLLRALEREHKDDAPRYAEVCRRYLADEADFSEERLKEAGIRVRYRNRDLLYCLDEIAGVVVNYA